MTTDDKIRLSFRITPEDLEWLSQMAEDEGVENSDLVRMIINRLRRGRAPLISMMETPLPQAARPYATASNALLDELPYVEAQTGDLAEDVLAARLSEMGETGTAQVIDFQPEGEAAAMPIRRVDRQRWNPGRK